MIAWTAPQNVIVELSTSEPLGSPSDRSASSIPCVQEETPTANSAPTAVANSVSKAATSRPVVTQPDAITPVGRLSGGRRDEAVCEGDLLRRHLGATASRMRDVAEPVSVALCSNRVRVSRHGFPLWSHDARSQETLLASRGGVIVATPFRPRAPDLNPLRGVADETELSRRCDQG